jgi:ATP-dependent protease ClpP protease subunit
MKLPAIRVRNLSRLANLAGPDARGMRARIVRNDAGPARLDVYDDIGTGWLGGGICAADIVAQLADIAGPLEVHVNSNGGDVFDGIAIYNALAARDEVTIVVDGVAASIASIIAQGGQTRVIAPGAMMMIHDALSFCIGNAGDMRDTANLLDKVSDNLADVYASRGGTPAQWRDAMQAETWYSAQDAVDAGLMDKLAARPAAPDAVAAHDFTFFAKLPRWVRAAAAVGDEQDGQGDAPTCKTCGGSGRLKHPSTGKNSVKCPGCNGTGKAPQSGDDEGEQGGTQDGGRRVLGIESMPIVDGPIPVHHTATVDQSWDGPAAVAAMPNDDAVLRYCHAWQSDEAENTPHKSGDDDADDKKSAYKFPHHRTKGGPANVTACQAILNNLAGGRTEADIPDGDVAGVRSHAQAHLDDAKKNDSSSDHGHTHLSGLDPEEIMTALKEVFA